MAVDYENLTDEEYFACLKLMFLTEGWEVLMIELQEQAHQINDVQQCVNAKDLRFRLRAAPHRLCSEQLFHIRFSSN